MKSWAFLLCSGHFATSFVIPTHFSSQRGSFGMVCWMRMEQETLLIFIPWSSFYTIDSTSISCNVQVLNQQAIAYVRWGWLSIKTVRLITHSFLFCALACMVPSTETASCYLYYWILVWVLLMTESYCLQCIGKCGMVEPNEM